MESNAIESERGKKRKKKRSAMQMAKKYARRSERGHGTELDPDTYRYMMRILEMSRQDVSTTEEKIILAKNVYEETIGREIEFARNQVGSRILDSLMKYASYDAVKRLADALAESLRPICSDRFASHVLEEIIRVCTDRGNPAESDDPKDSEGKNEEEYNELALKLCRYVVNNFEEFVWDTYANRLVRTVVECLGGLTEKKERAASDWSQRRSVRREYTDLLVDVGNRLLEWPQLVELGKDPLASGLLQTLLHTLRGVDSKLVSKLIERIVGECFDQSTELRSSTIFDSESSVRLLEACLAVAKSKMYSRIYRRLFADRLGELCLAPCANFAVQRLLDRCRSKEQLEEMFDLLEPRSVAILNRKNTGIFVSLANACVKLQCKQGPFVNSMAKTLGCDESRIVRIASAVAALQTYGKVEESRKDEASRRLPVHLHGSIVLQAMLNFNKPIKIVNSLLAMSIDELVALATDPKGSRVFDAFMDSKFVGEKSRDKLAKMLQGNWVDLARDTHGSRCLDKIWRWSKTTQRLRMMEELASAGESLNSTKTGRLIAGKLDVALFARNKSDWSEARGKEEKTKALFASIIVGTPTTTDIQNTQSAGSRKLRTDSPVSERD